MSNVWATFAVVFLAIYTANLAAFMITREDYLDFSGIEDPRLKNAEKLEPALRFGTIPYGNTEAVLKRNKPRMHMYMRKYNRSTSWEGVKAVKRKYVLFIPFFHPFNKHFFSSFFFFFEFMIELKRVGCLHL